MKILKNFGLFNTFIYLFPAYLVIFEYILRTLLDTNDTSSFIGPTLASSGLSFLIGSTKSKEMKNIQKIKESVKENPDIEEFIPRNPKDESLIHFCWIFIFIGILFWYGSCSLALKGNHNEIFIGFFQIKLHFLCGVIVYIVGISTTMVKEMI